MVMSSAEEAVKTPYGKTDPVNAGERDEEDDDPLATDGGPEDIHAKLRALRLDEVVGLSQSGHNVRTISSVDNYLSLVFLETRRYLGFCIRTIWYIIGTGIFGGLNPFDFFSIAFFGIGGIIFLFFVLVFCLAMHFPTLVRIYYMWADKYGGGLGLVNSANPNLFKSLTKEQAEAAKEALSRDYKESGNTETQRFFDYDAAKLLLQIASVIYEHEGDAIRNAIKITIAKPPKSLAPTLSAATSEIATALNPITHRVGNLMGDLYDKVTSKNAEDALDSEGDKVIRAFVKEFGLDFEPVSELNSTSSAFSGLFWDPKGNWMVVAFKGTAPIEFSEWLSDFNTKLVMCGNEIPGFSKCHLGFKERVFPTDVSQLGGARPYDTVLAGIKTLSKHLRKENGHEKINVYFTGHSLGCATASLMYARMLMRDTDLGKKTQLRDAYLYAAPITVDRASVMAFNAKMVANHKKIKTMWRITSNGDAVATLLPELGDYTSIAVSPTNAFAFAHLGTEVIMKDNPYPSKLSGNHISYGAQVAIKSKFSHDELAEQRGIALAKPGELRRVIIGVLLQRIPLIGRVAAHCTVFYWDQLDRIALGTAEWTIG